MTEARSGRDQTRARILSAALDLLQEGGRDNVTTRAVAERAGVQPPVLYRMFKDKEGLLNALAEHGFMLYVPQKGPIDVRSDPVEALRSGWDRHVQFGLAHPSLYLLMYTGSQVGPSPAAELSLGMLHQHIERVATAGRLRLPTDRAVALFHSAGTRPDPIQCGTR
jgi:AcrR family transcriptional regulator